jgi:hypothetical protein
MTPTTKEHITIAILLVSAFLMLALICFSLTGCATAPVKPSADVYAGHVSVVMFTFCGFVNMNAQEISKADILATVKHMAALASEQKLALQKADADFQKQSEDLAKADAEAKLMASQAHQNAKERDVVVWAFAICFAAFFVRTFPTVGWIVVAETSIALAIGYAMGRFALAWVAHLIP